MSFSQVVDIEGYEAAVTQLCKSICVTSTVLQASQLRLVRPPPLLPLLPLSHWLLQKVSHKIACRVSCCSHYARDGFRPAWADSGTAHDPRSEKKLSKYLT